MRSASKFNGFERLMATGLALAIALPPSAIALADDNSRLALAPIVPLFGPMPGSVPQATADKITELLARELRKQDGIELVPIVAKAPPPTGPARPSKTLDDDDEGGGDSAGDAVAPFQGAGDRALTKGLAQIAKGKKDMQRLKFDAAAADFQEGIAAIEGSFDLLTDYGPLVDAYLQLAIAELRLGQRESGEQALSAVIRLAPERSLTGNYPAVFTRLYASLKQKLTQGAKGTLGATSTPAGQLVRIDGRDSGATPASLELIPGIHFVVIAGEGGKLAYKVDLPEGGNLQVGSGAPPAHHAVKVASGGTGDTEPPPVKPPPVKVTPPPPTKGDDQPLAKLIAEITANNIDEGGGRALGKVAAASTAQAILFGGVHYLDDEQATIALDCMLYQQSTKEVAALTRVQFDSDLTSAPVELLKVATEAAQKLAHWSDVIGLPQPVAPGLKPPKARVAGAHEAKRPDDDGLIAASHTRKVDAVDGNDLGPGQEVAKSGDSGFPWLGVGIGVGAAVVVAVAVVVIVSVATQKAGVNTGVNW